jgi:hypothetical protein
MVRLTEAVPEQPADQGLTVPDRVMMPAKPGRGVAGSGNAPSDSSAERSWSSTSRT